MNDSAINVVDLLDLPLQERQLVLLLARHGRADGATLAQLAQQDLATVQQHLQALISRGRVQRLASGQYKAVLGQVRPRTAIPDSLLPALLAGSSHYSEQEIAALRTAVPMLQFARARLTMFSDHGPGHVLRVKSFATQLSYILNVSPTERQLLRMAAIFHDIGNVVDRDRHHLISQETVVKLTRAGRLPYTGKEAEIIGQLCCWHRREYDPERVDDLQGQAIRIGLLASILRVADAMDIDYRRADHPSQFMEVLEFFYQDRLPYWDDLNKILGVRTLCDPQVTLQVFSSEPVADRQHYGMLGKDLAGTPLGWSLAEVVAGQPQGQHTGDEPGGAALLAFPFEPNSLVMAALSRAHLWQAGYSVTLLCYPDSPQAPAWLWEQALAECDPLAYARLVVIGDRPSETAGTAPLQEIARWRKAGRAVSVLNRYEANWSRLPDLLALGTQVVVGGDWAYFWGSTASPAELAWARIAALCTRDTSQNLIGVSDNDWRVVKGLLRQVYAAENQAGATVEAWGALALPLLDLIADDRREVFSQQAEAFDADCAAGVPAGRVDGRVVIFDHLPPGVPTAIYWTMEAAIERQGRTWERGVAFRTPYALAAWEQGENTEILAISHWLDERAIPIRLLFPHPVAAHSGGTECALQVSLPTSQARGLLKELIRACNHDR